MLNDRKITDWTQPVSSLDDRPQMTAAALKAAFDSNTNQIKPAVNGMIDDLTGTGGAGNIGVDVIAGVTGTTVQAMLAALKALIDLCDTSETVDDKLDLKADKTTTDKLVKTITLNADTGVFTIQTEDGTTTTIDTLLEKIPVNCYLDGQEFVLVLDDGTEQRADLSDFITETEFTDSSTIDFSVTGSNVTATIKNGSITLPMLENTVMSTLQGYMTAAQTAASNAATSETNAGTYRDQAQSSATAATASASEADSHATESESWAVGGTGTRQGEDTNNSKYFAQQSANSATTAQGWSDSAMEQADKSESAAKRAEQAAADAEAIAGGDYIPNSQKGVAGGVATLGSDGKVQSEQLPEMNYIPTSQKGAASGVASLDATGKLEETQKPDYTASEVGAVPTARTVNEKALTEDVTLTGDDIKTSASDETTISSQLSNAVMNIGKVPQSIFGNPGYPTSYVGSVDDRDTLMENLPGPGHWRILYIPYFAAASEGWSVQIAIGAVDNAGLYWRKARGFTWAAWENAATPTPPQEFDLSPADGWTHTHTWDKSSYCKTQEDLVIVHFSLENSSAAEPPDAGYIIAYLPEGFRPSAAVIGTCGDYNHSGENLYQCWVTTDGAIIVYSPAAAPKAASGTLVFVAAS